MTRRSPSKREPKLLAVDLDGTLLDARGKPHLRDVRALRALAERNISCSIVTGRLYSGTRASAEAAGINGPVGCVDGSHLVDARTHGTLVHHAIRGATARAVRGTLAQHKPATFVFARDLIVHDELGEPFLGYVTTWSLDIERTAHLDSHGCWDDDEGITALVAVGTSYQIASTVSDMQKTARDAVQIASFPIRRLAGMWGMVLRAAGGSKGSALQWLAAHHGLDLDQTVCVGDWFNDVSMFEVAGRSYAMGHAPDDVKKSATDVLPETSEQGGGIARVVEEAFGIRISGD